MRKKKYYAITNGFYDKYSEIEINIDAMKSIAEEYREIVCPALCKYNFKLNHKQALWLCDTLGQGNWKKMWTTEEDDAESDSEVCRLLIGDVFYCSDRMSWDRLTRINWQYQRLIRRIEQKTKQSEM